MKKVSNEEIKMLDDIFHKILFLNYRNSGNIFKDENISITPLEITVLNIVTSKSDIIIKDIIDILNIPNSTLTNVVNRLEKKNLVERVINKNDKRSYGLKITDKGKEMFNKHEKYEEKLFKKILFPLSIDERLKFIKSLNKIYNNFIEEENIDL